MAFRPIDLTSSTTSSTPASLASMSFTRTSYPSWARRRTIDFPLYVVVRLCSFSKLYWRPYIPRLDPVTMAVLLCVDGVAYARAHSDICEEILGRILIVLSPFLDILESSNDVMMLFHCSRQGTRWGIKKERSVVRNAVDSTHFVGCSAHICPKCETGVCPSDVVPRRRPCLSRNLDE
jgi:hypothetical protein